MFNSDFYKCMRVYPNQISNSEFSKIKEMLLDTRYKYWSVASLSSYAKKKDIIYACASTWYKVNSWCNIERKRVKKPRHEKGVRASKPNEIWHGDISIFKKQIRSVEISIPID